MKKQTLSFCNKLLALIIIALGFGGCKTRQHSNQVVKEDCVDLVVMEDTISPIICKYGVRPVQFDTILRDTTNQQPKDTIRRMRRPNPGAIRALYGVFPTEFLENVEK